MYIHIYILNLFLDLFQYVYIHKFAEIFVRNLGFKKLSLCLYIYIFIYMYI